MTISMRAAEWLRFLRTEYLETYVREGGSAVKFAIPFEDAARSELDAGISSAARELGFLRVQVDAAETRVHLVDQVLYRITEQLDWNDLCVRVVAALAEQRGLRLPEPGDGSFGDRLAAANATDAKAVLMEMRPVLTQEVYKNRRLAKDFRIAMMHLCLGQLSGESEAASTTQVLTDWLTGRNKSVSAVRHFQIFNRINRTNARHLLESTLAWVRLARHPGTILQLDIDRLVLPRNPRDDRPFYTTAALLDAYEVLRQFIDGSDRLGGCLLLITAGKDFLDEDPQGRGLGRYEALKFRVFDEVHDRDRANPMASLIRLVGPSGDGALA